MTPTEPIVDHLMKVSLEVKSADGSDRPFAFVFGIGPGGISPFEKALYGRKRGERVTLPIPFTGPGALLGHLALPLFEQTGITAPQTLEVTIVGITRAADRDVVKAMAAGGSCDDCGCGCGGH